MNETYIVAIYSVDDKIIGMRAVGSELVVNAVMMWADASHKEDEDVVTKEMIDKEISSNHHIFRKSFRKYSVGVCKLDDLTKKILKR